MKSVFGAVAMAAMATTAAAQGAAYAQCGGSGWSGSKTCVSGYTCTYVNDWYSQCLPGSGGGNNPPPTTTSGGGGNQPPSHTGSAQKTLCTQYAYYETNGYAFNNNLWGTDAAEPGGSQCTYYYGSSGNGVSWGTTWSWTGGQNNVKSYAWVGATMSPKLLSNIRSLPTTSQWSYSGSNTRANVAYDIFTHPDPNHVTYNGEYELMIWLGQLGGVGPISQTGNPIATVTLAGHRWNLHFGYNGSMKVYSFVTAEGSITNFSGDVYDFFKYLAQNQGFPMNNQYMLIYQFGTEAFTGRNQEFYNSQFSARVN